MPKIDNEIITGETFSAPPASMCYKMTLVDVDRHVKLEKDVVPLGDFADAAPDPSGSVPLADVTLPIAMVAHDSETVNEARSVHVRILRNLVDFLRDRVITVNTRHSPHLKDKYERDDLSQTWDWQVVESEHTVKVRVGPRVARTLAEMLVNTVSETRCFSINPEVYLVGNGVLTVAEDGRQTLRRPGRTVRFLGGSTTRSQRPTFEAHLSGNVRHFKPAITKLFGGAFTIAATALAALMRMIDEPSSTLSRALTRLNPEGNETDNYAVSALALMLHYYKGDAGEEVPKVIKDASEIDALNQAFSKWRCLPWAQSYIDLPTTLIVRNVRIAKLWIVFSLTMAFLTQMTGGLSIKMRYDLITGRHDTAKSMWNSALVPDIKHSKGGGHLFLAPATTRLTHRQVFVPSLFGFTDCDWPLSDDFENYEGESILLDSARCQTNTTELAIMFGSVQVGHEAVTQLRKVRTRTVMETVIPNRPYAGWWPTGFGFLMSYISHAAGFAGNLMEHGSRRISDTLEHYQGREPQKVTEVIETGRSSEDETYYDPISDSEDDIEEDLRNLSKSELETRPGASDGVDPYEEKYDGESDGTEGLEF
jgi:hypothetical protein